MSIKNDIKKVVTSLPSTVLKDQKKAYDTILAASTIIFLDTCFMSDLQVYKDDWLLRLLEVICEEYDSSKTVFVITELILYESRDPRSGEVQKYLTRVVDIAQKKNIKTVLIAEEEACKYLSQYHAVTSSEWNKSFLLHLEENKANLGKLMGVIRSDTSSLIPGDFKPTTKILKDSSYIENAIAQIKERKADKDSLGEELICLLIFFLIEYYIKDTDKKTIFCSVDNQALARMRMAVSTSFGKDVINFENIHLFSLTQYMVLKEIVTDRKVLISLLSKNMPTEIRVVEKKDLPFCENEQVLPLTDIVDGMLKGKKYQYTGNAKKQ